MRSPLKGIGELPLANNLSYRISILHALLGRLTAGIYTSRGLTSHQWKVLSILYSRPPMAAARITELVTIDKAAISRAITGLLELQLVDRTLDAMSGTISVMLKETGRVMYREMMTEMRVIQDRILVDLSTEEKGALFMNFDAIEAALRDSLNVSKPSGVAGNQSSGTSRGASRTQAKTLASES